MVPLQGNPEHVDMNPNKQIYVIEDEHPEQSSDLPSTCEFGNPTHPPWNTGSCLKFFKGASIGLQDLQQGSPYCCVNRRGILKDGIPSILAIVLPSQLDNGNQRSAACDDDGMQNCVVDLSYNMTCTGSVPFLSQRVRPEMSPALAGENVRSRW
ncbi:hypothetical protein B0O80DRAFT_423236 [Mortierella sp. GBAus27b]|nr:hypothetical protein B0O80DRAFT_423236 [Mortierella sp. GBAus27b]